MLNVFFYRLLLALGYHARLMSCDFRLRPNNHCLIYLFNLNVDGDRYLIDVGSGYKMGVISLDFAERSQIYFDSFASTYYEWDATRTIVNKIRVKKEGDLEQLGPIAIT